MVSRLSLHVLILRLVLKLRFGLSELFLHSWSLVVSLPLPYLYGLYVWLLKGAW